MRILQVTNFFKPSWEAGGPVRVSYELSKALARKRHEVTVYTSDGFKWRLDVRKNKPVDVDGIRTYYFKNFSNYLSREKNILTPYNTPKIARKEIQDFDVIHIHEGNALLGTVVYHYAKKYNIPYILQAHGALPKETKGVLYSLFGCKILRDATKVIALTKTEAEQYEKMGINEKKIEIVPNGINLTDYKNMSNRGEFRRKYGIKNSEKIVLYAGRLHKTKGVDLLIKAFADITKELNNIRLVIIGPDDGFQSILKEFVQRLKIQDKVLFVGFVGNKEKTAAFVDADVFVTPSFSGFPVTFLEACACGTPIITTNNGDELDWIDEKVGYVVKYDRGCLKDAIIKVLSDEITSRRFGEYGKKLVREQLNWNEIVNRVEQIYIKTIGV